MCPQGPVRACSRAGLYRRLSQALRRSAGQNDVRMRLRRSRTENNLASMAVGGPTAGTNPFVGMRLGGLAGARYELQAPLGSGLFGTVWRAFDHDEQATIALKLLNPTVTP